MIATLTMLPDPVGSAHRTAATIDQSPCNGCDACGDRCTAGVPMSHPEYLKIREFLGSPEGRAVAEVELQDKHLPYPGTDVEDAFSYEACRFRDVEARRCSIYPVRPLVCRLFGHTEWLPCPIDAVPHRLAGAVDLMRVYGTTPWKSYEEWLAQDASDIASQS